MSDPVIRPKNGVLLIALQSAEGTPAVPDPALHAVPYEADSESFNTPFRTEDSTEVTGSSVASAPLIVGQPATFAFRSRLKGAGAGAVYSSSVKPPLHAALQACGMRGQFTAAIAAAALTAGTTSSATLGAGYAGTAEQYRGMPLILSVGQGAGRIPMITGYTAGKVATLSDLYGAALDNTTLAALPANWTYAGTSPADLSARATDEPFATIRYYEDGTMIEWIDCHGTVDFDGASAKPGIAAFSFTGVYNGKVDAALPNAVVAGHSAPLLLKGQGLPPAFQIGRRGLPISRWSLQNGSQIESPEDPNTPAGFAGGQITDRKPIFECDPLSTQVAARNVLADIAAFSTYPGALQFGTAAGNRVALTLPLIQPIESTPGKRGALRSETNRYQCLNPGDDAYGRDGDRILCFY